MSVEKSPLQFVSVSSFVQASFWNKLAELKLDVDKLDDGHRKIWGYFSDVFTAWPTQVIEVDSTSFNSSFEGRNCSVPYHGKVFNKNTIEQFKECNKTELIQREGREFFDNLTSGAILEKPSLLNLFLVLSFSDLKKYHFYYWFAFPVPQNVPILLESRSNVLQEFQTCQLNNLAEAYSALDPHQKAFFLVHNLRVHTLRSKLKELNEDNYREFYFAFSDHNLTPNCPKSQLKNYVIFLLHHCPFLGGKTVSFLLFSLDQKSTCRKSEIYKLILPTDAAHFSKNTERVWVGWEKNESGKLLPRFVSMKNIMDPKKLYADSVDLNLKLMKWRLLPDIDLDKVKNLKCLLLGSGTLGCSVARTLLGWGVRNVTFVDNSTVSFSNPVRQSLFTYKDSVDNRPKAEAAADGLRAIFPGINAKAFQLTIPMPGHSVGDSLKGSVADTVKTLQRLVHGHDVIYLLTDSRESRWLPTVLGTAYDKIIINVALGFDSYLIMRYGGRKEDSFRPVEVPEGFKSIPGNQLGCYFCNDVTAPGNSLKDRTLDQQCTVTRPGVSSVAGALAVELTISIVQHEEGMNAPAFYKLDSKPGLHEDVDNQTMLGILPHSIRGFLSNFTNVLPATPRYDRCIACSSTVLKAFKAEGFEFLCRAFNSSKYLEDLTGLSELFDEKNYAEVLEIDDNEDWDR